MIAGLSRWLRAPARPDARALGLAAALGAGVAAGQAPLGWWFVALPALAGLIAWILRAPSVAQAAWAGWAAGFGYALAAMFWIVEPFLVDPWVHGWMAPFALVLMAAGMGLFWALGTGLGAALAQRPVARALGVAAGLALSDLLRSYLFTGFPWVLLGHVWVGTPVAQAAAVVGPVGLSLVTTLLAAGLALAWPGAGPRRTGGGRAALRRLGPSALALVALAGLWAGGAARLATPEPARDTPIRLRLVQPNAPQHLKWHPDYRLDYFYRHLDLTAAPADAPTDLVIWPETAVPFLLDRPGDGLAMIAEAAGGVPVALGVQRAEGLRYFNSLAVIGADAQPGAVYDKFHLVPFGEYIPFGDALARLGLRAFAAQEGNGYTPGPGARVLDLGPLGRVQPLICYEAVFPQDLRAAPERPDWLMQVTNDAWFGNLSGPWQHLAQARLRAIETGLPLARAANTGVSAVIDGRGRVVAALGLDQAGVVDADLPAALPVTPYWIWGDGPVAGAILALIAGLALHGRRARRPKAIDPRGGAV
ncbi:apolipoprotein N-acyltransferase [Phaeovulum sp. NW3]|uniref:apolipoprotein N-acyltransferase n=1 Tax=Phaeovulum sp. NW3 TaxID=2934933 RepID=UPI00202220DC|nr:apolipoprotein N-acyltransferase [Phaeovulum sp. NW3]MCL7464912.1 apolipoprotein N-acyltransferase [Phaeovulum sp. NW3]